MCLRCNLVSLPPPATRSLSLSLAQSISCTRVDPPPNAARADVADEPKTLVASQPSSPLSTGLSSRRLTMELMSTAALNCFCCSGPWPSACTWACSAMASSCRVSFLGAGAAPRPPATAPLCRPPVVPLFAPAPAAVAVAVAAWRKVVSFGFTLGITTSRWPVVLERWHLLSLALTSAGLRKRSTYFVCVGFGLRLIVRIQQR